MTQQINLLAPILLTPRRYFSALAVVQATGLLVVAGALVAVWLQRTDARAQQAHEQLLAQLATERQSLQVAQAGLPPATDPAALEQQLQSLRAGNAQRAAWLQSLGPDAAPGRRHSDLLSLVARTQPQEVWLDSLRWSGGQLELSGGTLEPARLKPWLGQLADHPLLAGQALQALRVERLQARLAGDRGTPLLASPEADALTRTALPVWAFRVLSAPNPPASAASR